MPHVPSVAPRAGGLPCAARARRTSPDADGGSGRLCIDASTRSSRDPQAARRTRCRSSVRAVESGRAWQLPSRGRLLGSASSTREHARVRPRGSRCIGPYRALCTRISGSRTASSSFGRERTEDPRRIPRMSPRNSRLSPGEGGTDCAVKHDGHVKKTSPKNRLDLSLPPHLIRPQVRLDTGLPQRL